MGLHGIVVYDSSKWYFPLNLEMFVAISLQKLGFLNVFVNLLMAFA